MKTFIATLLLSITSISFAMNDYDIFVAKNGKGGEIFLLSDECPIPGSEGARVSVTTYQNYLVVGCWFFYQEKIYAVWLPEGEEPVKSEYNPEIFTLEKLL